MSKALYIVGIVFSVLFLFIVVYYAEEVSDARLDYLFSDFGNYSSYSYDSYSSYSSYSSSSEYKDLTVEAGLWSLFFLLAFTALNLIGLIKVKTKTSKVISIIGLSVSGIFLLWDLAVISSPGSLSFDEVSPGFGFYCMIMLAFTIIGVVQSTRYQNRLTSGGATASASGDLLDS